MQTRSPRHVRLAAATALAAAFTLTLTLGTAQAAGPGSIPASPPQHFIDFNYTVPEDFNTYTYTVEVDTPLATDSIYYAHYVWGKNNNGYYSGIQPHPNGKAGVRFSYFGSNATPDNPNCHGDADGGAGVTCAIDDLDYAAGRKYTITTRKSESADAVTYTGTIKDLTSGKERTIGSWRLPQDFAGFSPNANAFIEKFSGISTCADIPPVNVSYTGVTANGSPVNFHAGTHPATDVPGDGIYTCSGVSQYTVTTPAPGSYTVVSTVPSG
ncbi:DUF3472 domain-containing protein [Kitasatospora sp. NPDC101183]|uniref:DUF3472 domain-containing protein n=1 Tax=Kitasatospora sp. NPDC101183 TaxID=3364100 RepID=UPI003816DB49